MKIILLKYKKNLYYLKLEDINTHKAQLLKIKINIIILNKKEPYFENFKQQTQLYTFNIADTCLKTWTQGADNRTGGEVIDRVRKTIQISLICDHFNSDLVNGDFDTKYWGDKF